MKIVLYGLPCSGKTTLMGHINGAKIISGSKKLHEIAHGRFSELSETEKRNARIKYTEYINALPDELIISDGHYSFLENIVFTEADGDLYDVFMYVYCSPKTLLRRYATSEKNKEYSDYPINIIDEWQNFEIESLRKECHKRNKDFYVISDNENRDCKFLEFLNRIKNGFSSYRLAEDICRKIKKLFPSPCFLNVVDGDKTIIKQNSFKYCLNGSTTVFDGDFYTGYQAFLFENEFSNNKQHPPLDVNDKIADIEINQLVIDEIKNDNYVVLSSGVDWLWKLIGKHKKINNIFASIEISADTKYYVVKILKHNGYRINAYGDGKLDLYMIKEAEKGFLVIPEKISRSLKNVQISNLFLKYNKSPYILSDEYNNETVSDIMLCKSDSGINGNLLAAAHFRLGQKLGEKMLGLYPNNSTALLILERGGRFFGDGIYTTFGGVFYAVNPSEKLLPQIREDRIVIIDSVINTGGTIIKIISRLKKENPDIDVVIATNVIQEKAMAIFKDYKLFAVRKSSNSFVGENCAKQIDGKGPDTADRLFNQIVDRFS